MSFVAYDVCRIIGFVHYEVCRLIGVVAYDVCHIMTLNNTQLDWILSQSVCSTEIREKANIFANKKQISI